MIPSEHIYYCDELDEFFFCQHEMDNVRVNKWAGSDHIGVYYFDYIGKL